MTILELKEEVAKLCNKYPNAVYQQYNGDYHYDKGIVTNGPEKEGCLIGQALSNFGMELKVNDSIGMISGEIFGNSEVENDPHNINWLINIQEQQDFGKSWGQAFKITEELYQEDMRDLA